MQKKISVGIDKVRGAASYHAPGKNKFAGFQYFEICGHRYTGNTSKVLYIRRSERTDSL